LDRCDSSFYYAKNSLYWHISKKYKQFKYTIMGTMLLIPVLFYLTIVVAAIYFIYTWVTTIISLKREHNDLLREILKKMDKTHD